MSPRARAAATPMSSMMRMPMMGSPACRQTSPTPRLSRSVMDPANSAAVRVSRLAGAAPTATTRTPEPGERQRRRQSCRAGADDANVEGSVVFHDMPTLAYNASRTENSQAISIISWRDRNAGLVTNCHTSLCRLRSSNHSRKPSASEAHRRGIRRCTAERRGQRKCVCVCNCCAVASIEGRVEAYLRGSSVYVRGNR